LRPQTKNDTVSFLKSRASAGWRLGKNSRHAAHAACAVPRESAL